MELRITAWCLKTRPEMRVWKGQMWSYPREGDLLDCSSLLFCFEHLAFCVFLCCELNSKAEYLPLSGQFQEFCSVHLFYLRGLLFVFWISCLLNKEKERSKDKSPCPGKMVFVGFLVASGQQLWETKFWIDWSMGLTSDRVDMHRIAAKEWGQPVLFQPCLGGFWQHPENRHPLQESYPVCYFWFNRTSSVSSIFNHFSPC